MTWQNPRLADAALQWRRAQSALVRSQRPILVKDEERSSSLAPTARAEGDTAALQLRAAQALSECLRISRQTDHR